MNEHHLDRIHAFKPDKELAVLQCRWKGYLTPKRGQTFQVHLEVEGSLYYEAKLWRKQFSAVSIDRKLDYLEGSAQ